MRRAEIARRVAVAGAIAAIMSGCGPKRPIPRPRQPEGLALAPAPGPSPVCFVETAEEAGVRFVQDNGSGVQRWFYVETLGSGAIFFDADDDGDADLYFCNGCNVDGPRQDPPPTNAFFRNDGKGRFVEATVESGLGDARYSMGVCGADYDNDGDVDLYVTNFDDANALYQNDGHGRFTDVAARAGVSGRPNGVDAACAFADVDNDGLLDLYVGGCVDATRRNNKECKHVSKDPSRRVRAYCEPNDYKLLPSFLYRNRGDGTFEDATERSGISSVLAHALAACFCDFDDDRDQDLFVACDRSQNLFFENDGDGRFREIGEQNGTALSPEGRARAGMGVSAGDYDGDGALDFAVSYFEGEWSGLYRNLGHLDFEDCAVASNTAHGSFHSMKWGTELFDADLDGRLDWLVTSGHIHPNLEEFPQPPRIGYEQPMLFFHNRGDGLFEELGSRAGPAFSLRKVSRGFATADVDGDGDLDAVVNNLHGAAWLLRNDSPREDRHWLIVKTTGSKSNRDGIGARVTVKAGEHRLVREIHSGQSYLSQSDLRAHFGLGRATVVDSVEVRWPSCLTSRLEHVAVDQVLEIREPRE